MNLQRRSLFAAVVIVASGSIALAQGDRRPMAPPPPAGDAGERVDQDDLRIPDEPDPALSPERMKEMLERRIERNALERKALDTALEMLKRGESPEAVREHLRGLVGDAMRERAQAFRERRPPRPAGAEGPGGPGDRPRPPGHQPPRVEGPGRDGPPPRPFGGPPPPEAGPRPMDRLMSVLRETHPRVAERLERLRRDDPEQFQRLFDEYAPRLARLAEERERLPARWPDRVKQLLLQQRAGGLAREIASMPEEQRSEAMARLRANLEEQFDLRLRFAREDLARNKEQAERLEREISEKSGDKSAAIERQMKEMLERARDHAEPADAISPGVL
ncbi:MAG: hypothetical protein JNK58_14145 [Phycisphaerae bacterium]|nr:hypothetical protein [Phycisphaerae bacterium]